MAKKISQLTQATEVKSDDVTVIVQDGETKKLPLNMMVTKQDIENKKIAGLAKLDEIEATYENDTYTPTITVKNKSSVKTGEGDEVDYSANVMDGHVKSAILKGCTLVNKEVNLNRVSGTNWIKTNNIYTLPAGMVGSVMGKMDLEANTKYIVKYSCSSTLTNIQSGNYVIKINTTGNDYNGNIVQHSPRIGENSFTFTTNDITDVYMSLYVIGYAADNDIEVGNFRIIKYQEGMENWDIPYFTGMQSVKMPVLTTTGKNLFNHVPESLIGKTSYGMSVSISDGKIRITGTPTGTYGYVEIVKCVEKGKQYTFSAYENGQLATSGYRLWVRYSDGTMSNSVSGGTFVVKNFDIVRVEFVFEGFTVGTAVNKEVNIQIEESPSPTPYEPYKSNILSTPSDLELRGIGDVKDELNCLTGEVTERIGEIVLDGSENWTKYEAYATNADGYTSFVATIPSLNNFYDNNIPSFVGTNFPTGTWNDYKADGARELVWNHDPNKIGIRVKNEKASNAEEIKSFLSTNNIRIVYKLAKESIKTVDLMPSGTHPSTTPYCWKNGHIQLSSSGLLPNLEYSVVTSRAGQINQNAAMIVKNDKRIFDLEILLAGGLVNTTYQALTLQNQVETGLSKVSLSSETEPDYLLYHMIMKLIEEKAYKLDDLTEKVSVFYLYEKLSDEQFETIYSALYPFVEDEIVEEPVVEELPEVVEDEVIM